MRQFGPMATLGPMEACGPTEVPAPMRAVGCTLADGSIEVPSDTIPITSWHSVARYSPQ